MKEKDKKRISEGIDDKMPDRTYPHVIPGTPASTINPADLPRKHGGTYEELATTLRIDIPKCNLIPVNGRIYVIEIEGKEHRTPGGIIMQHKLNIKKDDSLKNVKRYFVVDWDHVSIPQYIQDILCVGIEVAPFLPQEAEEWSLPKVIDWQTGQEFLLIDSMELAGISKTKPDIVGK
jgi:hypothetical protein